MTIHHLFYPRALAVVGSTAEGKIGYQLIKQIVAGGFNRVYAINPKAQGAFGVPAVRQIADLPEEPLDLVVIASPAPTVASVLEQCGQAGVKAAVVITAGFSEIGNQAGEEEIKRIARSHGMRVVGPNCAGIVNTGHNLFASLETRPPRGQVAFISQSGALGGAVLSWAEEQGVGFSKFVSYGNRADLDEISLLPYLADDPETTVAALYIESVADGRAFMAAVAAFTRRKPLVVIKSGRSQAGQRATLSHTGSLAGADAVYDAALRACGAIRVAGVEALFDLCKGFVTLPPVQGRRLVIVTNSGGPAVLAADHAEAVGLTVAEPGPELRQKLAASLPPQCAPKAVTSLYGKSLICSLKNPIDLTVEGTESAYRETLSTVLAVRQIADLPAAEYDTALALNVSTPYLDSVPLARGVCAAAALSGKPVVASFMAGRIVADGIAYLQEHGIPNFATGERAVAVLAHMAEYQEARNTQLAPALPSFPLPAPLPFSHSPILPFLEPEAMAWLRDNAIPTPDFRFAATADQACSLCREIGYPVVMKVVSPDIVHKSERGGVRLNVSDDATARAAFADIQRAAAGTDFRGVVIYPMVQGGAQEVLVGLSRDPQFGPVIVFGLGGIYTELLRDIALRVAPIERAAADAMIREIHSFPLLQGARGQPPRDLAALADLLVQVSRLPFRYPDLAELDLNPVFLLEQGLVVGDVRVILQQAVRQIADLPSCTANR